MRSGSRHRSQSRHRKSTGVREELALPEVLMDVGCLGHDLYDLLAIMLLSNYPNLHKPIIPQHFLQNLSRIQNIIGAKR